MKTRRFSTFLTSACLAAAFVSNVAPVGTAPPQAAPVMTAELMERLRIFALDFEGTGGVDGQICKSFSLCDGTKVMPMKMLESESAPDGAEHLLGFSLDADTNHIIFTRKRNGVLEAFLTDRSRSLRAAVQWTRGEEAHLITNERAAAQFMAELALWAKEAGDLPPTGQ